MKNDFEGYLAADFILSFLVSASLLHINFIGVLNATDPIFLRAGFFSKIAPSSIGLAY